ncbi:helix-turn-helix transcriptional regulator [Streptomyces sp. H51]|uniref:helix-turn-helix transcriptional regulator n=1 Tax=Streptomyces sp. H51 TaxID=3111770 RepID=UPI002D7764D1|nr:helix-turn-helix transcriptional regulator [Streptomyces sp. H51]
MDKPIVAKVYNGREWRYRRTKVLNMGHEELAAKVGVHPHSIHRWENGTRTPSAAQVVVMAHHLGIPIVELTDRVSEDLEALRTLVTLEKMRWAEDGEEPITSYPNEDGWQSG